jgi:hypothetical protein
MSTGLTPYESNYLQWNLQRKREEYPKDYDENTIASILFKLRTNSLGGTIADTFQFIDLAHTNPLDMGTF